MSPPGSKRIQARLALLEAVHEGREAEWFLEAALADRSVPVRERAIAVAAERLAPRRLVALLEKQELLLRAAVVECLCRIGPPALPALSEAIGQRQREVALACIQVVGRMEGEPAALVLLRGLAARGGDALLRAAAIQALGQQRDRTAVPVLLEALDQEPWVAFSAFEALGAIGDPGALGRSRALPPAMRRRWRPSPRRPSSASARRSVMPEARVIPLLRPRAPARPEAANDGQEAEAAPLLDAALLAFGGVVRARFGLGQLARSSAGLAHKLSEAMARAGWHGTALGFARALAQSGDDEPIAVAAAEALTNRETRFFRDPQHLVGLTHALLPGRVAQLASGASLRVLCAGCASGEEAYSLAMLIFEEMHRLWGHGLQVVGIDLSADAIATARRGRYPHSAVARAAGAGPANWELRYLRQVGNALQIRDFLRGAVRFERANLMSRESLAALGGAFDLVVCRNVLIYFDVDSLRAAAANLRALLSPGGALALGYAETCAAAELLGGQRCTGEVFWFPPEEEG